MPFGFRLPLVVRVLPGLLGGDGQDGETRAVAADLTLLWVFPEEADELDVIDRYIRQKSPFLPHFSGALKSQGCCFQSERLHSGRDPERLTGRNRESIYEAGATFKLFPA